MGDAAERAAFWRREGGANWPAALLALVAVMVIAVSLASLMPDELLYYDRY